MECNAGLTVGIGKDRWSTCSLNGFLFLKIGGIDWLIDWMIDWSIDWLIDWLIVYIYRASWCRAERCTWSARATRRESSIRLVSLFSSFSIFFVLFDLELGTFIQSVMLMLCSFEPWNSAYSANGEVHPNQIFGHSMVVLDFKAPHFRNSHVNSKYWQLILDVIVQFVVMSEMSVKCLPEL